MQKRSTGLTILGWFEIVVGVLVGLFFLFYLIYFLFYVESYNGMLRDYIKVLMIFLPPVVLLLALLFIGVNILKLKVWAWAVNIFLYPTIHIYLFAVRYWLPEQWWGVFFVRIIDKIFLIWWALPLFVVLYLIRPSVKAQFFEERGRSGPRNDR